MTAELNTQGLSPDEFRAVMGGYTTGVAVIATKVGDELHGMTVNSLTSVSLDPPLLLFCLTRGSRTAAAVTSAGRFVVNLLARGQKQISNTFARRGENHFSGMQFTLEEGLPVFTDSIGHLMCEVFSVHDGGDHVIVVGRVTSCVQASGDPLVFYRGRYVRNISYDDYPVPVWWA